MYVRIILVVGALLVGGWTGYRIAVAQYETRLHAQAVAYAQAADHRIAQLRAETDAQRAADIEAAEARGRAAQRARVIVREIPADPRDCGWTADQRLRIDRLYDAYGLRAGGSAAGLSADLPAAARD